MSEAAQHALFELLCFACGIVVGIAGVNVAHSAHRPDPLVCAHLRDVLTDPESQTSHGPNPDAVRAWERAECEGLQ